MPQKLIKYAQEPVVFYLHKKRNYVNKIATQQKQDVEDQLEKQREIELIKENQSMIEKRAEAKQKQKMRMLREQNRSMESSVGYSGVNR